MPITVFDAVGKFTADTRNLDEFVTKLDRALPDASQKSAVATKVLKDAQDNLKASLKALREEGGNTAQNWQKVADAQKQVAIASGANKRAHDDLNKSIGAVKESTREARDSAELLGEAFGIHLPREARKFIAEVPGIASLLKTAFSVTAIYFFIQALGEGILKIEDVVRALAGWDEAAKKAYTDQLALNQAFIDLAHQTEDLKVKEKERGLEGVALTKQQIADGKELLRLNTQRLQTLARTRAATQDQLTAETSLGKAVEAWSKGSIYIEERKELIDQLTAATKANDQELVALLKERLTIQDQIGNKEAELRKQSLDQYIATETAKTEAKRVATDAQIDLDLSVFRNEVAAGILSNQQLLALEEKTNEERYQNDLAAAQRKLELAKLDPTRNVTQIASIQGQILAMEREHNAALIDNDTEYVEEKKKLDALLHDPLLIQDLAAFDAQIEAAEQAHNANMLKITVDGLSAIAEARHRLQEQVDKGVFQAPTEGKITLSVDDQKLLDAQNILVKLGDQTIEAAKKAGEAQAAYDSLAAAVKTGDQAAISSQELLNDSFDQFNKRLKDIGGNTDLLLGLRDVLQEEIAATEAWGGSTAELEKKLQAVNRQLAQQIPQHIRVSQLLKQLTPEMRAYEKELEASGSKARAWGAAVGAGIADAAEAYGQGAITIEGALARIAAAQLNAIASIAYAKGTEQLAEAFGSWPDFAAMAHHFASAGLWFSLGGLLSYGAGKLSGGGRGGGGSAYVPQTEAASGITQGPVQQAAPQRQNVPHLATGGLVMGPTLAIIGDAVNGANSAQAALKGPGQRELVLPLDHEETMAAFAGSIVKHIPRETPIVHIHGKSLRHLIKDINHEVKNNDVELHSSNTYRVTKKA